MNPCAVCNKPSDKKCSLCSSVFYCSKEHQKHDWKKHRASRCLPNKIEENAELGRHLIAARRIAAGELILKEEPLVSGPFQVTPPICLGCYNLLSQLSCIDCPKCGWPMCSIDCCRSAQHFPECHITTHNRGSKVKIQTFQMTHPSYESITVLRCLYMKKKQPSLWEKLNRLQSHCDERKLTAKYEQDKQSVAKFIIRFFKYEEFSEEDILRVLGIININGHEVPTSNHDFVAIYETASYLEHNCHANCSKGFSSAGELVIRAAKPIEPGEHLSICYTDPLCGTASRMQHLKETKFFECACKRCQDATELETHYSSLKCTSTGCKGFVIPTVPLQSESFPWQCQTCHSPKSAQEVEQTISQASATLSMLDKTNIDSCKKYLSKFGTIFHQNHHLLTEVRLTVTQILENGINTISDENLNLKLTYCRQLEKLVTKLIPAENRCRGVLLFGLHAAMAEIGRRKSNKGEIGPDDLRNNLLECKQVLTEAYQLLRFEPVTLPEGQIAAQAKINLRDMERILQTLHANMGDSFL